MIVALAYAVALWFAAALLLAGLYGWKRTVEKRRKG